MVGTDKQQRRTALASLHRRAPTMRALLFAAGLGAGAADYLAKDGEYSAVGLLGLGCFVVPPPTQRSPAAQRVQSSGTI